MYTFHRIDYEVSNNIISFILLTAYRIYLQSCCALYSNVLTSLASLILCMNYITCTLYHLRVLALIVLMCSYLLMHPLTFKLFFTSACYYSLLINSAQLALLVVPTNQYLYVCTYVTCTIYYTNSHCFHNQYHE